MIYYNVKETAELWKISPQMVRRLCLDGRVTGAVLTDKGWIIPDFAEKPDKLDSTTAQECINDLSFIR